MYLPISETAIEEPDSGNESPTPKKPAGRQTRARGAKVVSKPKGKRKPAAKEKTPEEEDNNASDNEADGVVESLASSDDFGGYSD